MNSSDLDEYLEKYDRDLREEEIVKKIDKDYLDMIESFDSGYFKNIDNRIKYLKDLRDKIIEEENNIIDALHRDLNKSEIEAYMTEIGFILEEIKYCLKNIKSWVRPKRIRSSIIQFPSRIREYSEPYGTVLIMSPWNYPFQLSIAPIIGAIAAGNTIVLKPSEFSRNTSIVLSRIFRDNKLKAGVRVIKGGRFENEEILKKKFDYIFFTGSPRVGKIVMSAAADNLTPVTLELGGKSPVIVDENIDLKKTAKRICFGKLMNLGQTCVAPDYILIRDRVKDEFISELIRTIKEMIVDDEYFKNRIPKIINNQHFDRLMNYIEDEKIIFGGIPYEDRNQIYPTIIDEPKMDSDIMNEEIFGPIFPIISWSKTEEIIKIIKSKPKPLALYLFTNDRKLEKQILKNISFGGGCINDCLSHLISPRAGFGGVGNSGIGRYHGEYTYDSFSNKKVVLKKSWYLDIPFKYHPFKERDLKILKKFIK
ncbi:MAG: aldehyde dehydrogenase family protein [Andreesenia angusta]|nr:aldehyde dehydrogenase family protein [Andreesenia angusta]